MFLVRNGYKGIPNYTPPEAERDHNLGPVEALRWDPCPLGLPEIMTRAHMNPKATPPDRQ